jgi:hypothetical protein
LPASSDFLQTRNDKAVHNADAVLVHGATTDESSDLEAYLHVVFDLQLLAEPNGPWDKAGEIRKACLGFDGMGDWYNIAEERVGKDDLGRVDLVVLELGDHLYMSRYFSLLRFVVVSQTSDPLVSVTMTERLNMPWNGVDTGLASQNDLATAVASARALFSFYSSEGMAYVGSRWYRDCMYGEWLVAASCQLRQCLLCDAPVRTHL